MGALFFGLFSSVHAADCWSLTISNEPYKIDFNTCTLTQAKCKHGQKAEINNLFWIRSMVGTEECIKYIDNEIQEASCKPKTKITDNNCKGAASE